MAEHDITGEGLPARPDDLPAYERPPLVEVALTLGFQPISELRQAHLGVIWAAMRDEYPVAQDRPARDPMVGPQTTNITIQFSQQPPPHMAWFLNERGDRLLQIQSDRVVANWRIHPETDYPSFDVLYERFRTALDTIATTLEELAAPIRARTNIELAYVNWIDAEDASEFYRPAQRWEQTQGLTRILEYDRHSTRRMEVVHNGESLGEVTASLRPSMAPTGHSEQGKPGWTVELVHRRLVEPTPVQLPSRAYWTGRNAITRAFHAVTTPPFHDRWGSR